MMKRVLPLAALLLAAGLNLRAEEGRKSGLHEGILAMGLALGPLASGVAGELFPAWPGAILAAPGAVILLGLVVMLLLARRLPGGTIEASAVGGEPAGAPPTEE